MFIFHVHILSHIDAFLVKYHLTKQVILNMFCLPSLYIFSRYYRISVFSVYKQASGVLKVYKESEKSGPIGYIFSPKISFIHF